MHFWRYDMDAVLHHMTTLWCRPTSTPVLGIVLLVTAGVLCLQRLASL
jgi:hypothetical protein